MKLLTPQTRVKLPRRSGCRTCGAPIQDFLDFGYMPLAGAFFAPGEVDVERLYPMAVSFCPVCTLVQIADVVPKEVLFNDQYKYFSAVTATLNAHFEDYARFLRELVGQFDEPLILEFGCNDGVLLSRLQRDGVACFGVDASANVVEESRRKGLDVTVGFFNPEVARELLLSHGQPNVITGSNVFAHNDDVGEILEAANILLTPDGYFIVEVHYIADLLEGMQFDFFYHEHCNYYSLASIGHLLARHGFALVDVEHIPLHGGALRVVSMRKEAARAPSEAVSTLLASERRAGLHLASTYVAFAERVQAFRSNITGLLRDVARLGRRVCAYGASGRATTFLNYLGAGAQPIEFVLDESPARYDRRLPGLQLPILRPERAILEQADDCLITAWPYAQEIMRKEAWYPASGRSFIIPLPEIKVIKE